MVLVFHLLRDKVFFKNTFKLKRVSPFTDKYEVNNSQMEEKNSTDSGAGLTNAWGSCTANWELLTVFEQENDRIKAAFGEVEHSCSLHNRQQGEGGGGHQVEIMGPER